MKGTEYRVKFIPITVQTEGFIVIMDEGNNLIKVTKECFKYRTTKDGDLILDE